MATVRTTLDRYRSSLGRVQTLDKEVELELARRWRAGDRQAGDRLVKASLPFVIRIAREYIRWGAPLEDLVQQGNLGLWRAAEKFDPDKGCRLVTYAAYWIRAEIRDYVVRHYRIVRLGSTRTERRAMRTFRRKGVDNFEELAAESGMPLARAEKLWPLLVAQDRSLDVSYDSRPTGIQRLASEELNPEELVAREAMIQRVRESLEPALERLTDRERRIVEARMLADDDDVCTLEALGREMGVSKERIRQLEVRARNKLRAEFATFAA